MSNLAITAAFICAIYLTFGAALAAFAAIDDRLQRGHWASRSEIIYCSSWLLFGWLLLIFYVVYDEIKKGK